MPASSILPSSRPVGPLKLVTPPLPLDNARYAYRSLTKADAEPIASGNGIWAKNPNGSWTQEEHLVHGSGKAAVLNNPWIATSLDKNIAKDFSSGNGLVRIDLSRLPSGTFQYG